MATIGQLMTDGLITIRSDASLQQASEKMRDEAISALFVEEDNQYVGILTETDIVRKGTAGGWDPTQTPVRLVMSSAIISLDKDLSLGEAVDLMANGDIRHLAVTDGGTIVGLLSVQDILAHFKAAV